MRRDRKSVTSDWLGLAWLVCGWLRLAAVGWLASAAYLCKPNGVWLGSSWAQFIFLGPRISRPAIVERQLSGDFGSFWVLLAKTKAFVSYKQPEKTFITLIIAIAIAIVIGLCCVVASNVCKRMLESLAFQQPKC